ncbi:hypothetical protein D0Y65_000107 [Glycine soja]|uniref:Uncharacterized protein n=1 Tax=Glycine soja TaxID=3848 RepID=A0A445LX84_GLYSO|nr:hypothetical protein D0Y65_000107 [Glycine soja]
MTKKGKKQLMSSAPWRGEESEESFKEGKLKVTRQGDGTSTMHVPASKSKHHHHDLHDDLGIEIDPELRYSFQRNFQVPIARKLGPPSIAIVGFWFLQFLQRVFSIDTMVKPLPPVMAYNVSRNLNFFTRIFTQFFDPEGIANAQKSLGIGQEDKVRKVR